LFHQHTLFTFLGEGIVPMLKHYTVQVRNKIRPNADTVHWRYLVLKKC
jgi:hypothetical protein